MVHLLHFVIPGGLKRKHSQLGEADEQRQSVYRQMFETQLTEIHTAANRLGS